MLAVLDHIDTLTPYIKTYFFRIEKPFHYVAGEFTEMYLPHAGTDARGDRRWFTVSSSPTEPLVAITTKITPDGSSFKQALNALKPGDHAQLAEPMGDFVLPKDKNIPLVFVAAGLGITPVRSIVKFLADRDERRDIHVFRLAKTAEEEVFADEFHTYELRYCVYSSPGQHLTTRAILSVVKDNSLIYLAGPNRMIRTLSQELQQNAIPARRIITDLFPGYV